MPGNSLDSRESEKGPDFLTPGMHGKPSQLYLSCPVMEEWSCRPLFNCRVAHLQLKALAATFPGEGCHALQIGLWPCIRPYISATKSATAEDSYQALLTAVPTAMALCRSTWPLVFL
ncbi:hypothetical protein I7I53_05850 [Histoplasma capsulatum var. duboisii H88]|uniref:Uncharacterized protein n=1 Tax=Ajellomyces capsulatus (strain H88) TaxID=544711 RepID=A0A8A1LFH4_AJEC8|nr:hypothetical protein I7I53_05850 [Histoplasma capsulatum var. duboisii H88]